MYSGELANHTGANHTGTNECAGPFPLTWCAGRHLRVAMYSSELAVHQGTKECAGYPLPHCKNEWSGFDMQIWERMAKMGGFTYTFVPMREVTENHTYTVEAKRMVDEENVDVFGNPTWRTSLERLYVLTTYRLLFLACQEK